MFGSDISSFNSKRFNDDCTCIVLAYIDRFCGDGVHSKNSVGKLKAKRVHNKNPLDSICNAAGINA